MKIVTILKYYTFLLVVLLFPGSALALEMLSINGDNVNLRSGPATSYAVKWEYGNGFPVKVVQRKGQWVKVSDFEKDSGWIHESLLADKRTAIVNVNRNSDKKINIRKGPSTTYEVVGQAHYGVVFSVLERKGGWSRVRHESGLEGWIKDTLLWGL